MNREPVIFYIFRLIIGAGFLFSMVMLYWSSVLVEEQLKEVRTDLSQLKNDFKMMRSRLESGASYAFQTQNITSESGGQSKAGAAKNLLLPDPFNTNALPKLIDTAAVPWGTQRLATIGKPDNLHPFSQWYDVSTWNDLCSVGVAKSMVGKYETLSPDMGLRMEERINSETGIPEFWIFLREDVFWEPLKESFFPSGTKLAPQFLKQNQVTADDFKLWYDAIANPFLQVPGVISLRTSYGDIEEVRVVDKFTFVVRWKTHDFPGPDNTIVKKAKYNSKLLTGSFKPLAGFVYKYFADGKKIVEDDADPQTYANNSVWAQNFTEHWAKNIIVSCGGWLFDGLNERQIKFVRNPNFYDPLAVLIDRMEIEFKGSTENIWQAFKANELTRYVMQPDQLLEYGDFLKSAPYKQQEAKGAAIKELDYTNRVYSYIGWNAAKPFFNNKKVRQALTMSIDRRRIIQKNLNGMGVETNGTIYRYSPNYNTSIEPWPFNPQEARKILEEQGWSDTDGDGVIDKVIDGVRTPFSFSLTYFVKNASSKSICEYIATALKDVGIDCHLNGVDVADLSAVFDDKSFDALCLMWTFGSPPEDLRQLWFSSGAKEKGSSNMVGFSNAEADKIIEDLEYEYDPEKRVELYHRFSAILHEEQPYTFLFIPKVSLLYRETLQNVFLPVDRQDLIPGADIAEPISSIFWLKKES